MRPRDPTERHVSYWGRWGPRRPATPALTHTQDTTAPGCLSQGVTRSGTQGKTGRRGLTGQRRTSVKFQEAPHSCPAGLARVRPTAVLGQPRSTAAPECGSQTPRVLRVRTIVPPLALRSDLPSSQGSAQTDGTKAGAPRPASCWNGEGTRTLPRATPTSP